MQFTSPHRFTKDEAIRRVKSALDEARPKLPEEVLVEEERWEGDTLHFAFTAQGQHIEGLLLVREKEFEINATLPLMLRLFENRIKEAIEERTKQMLGS